MSAAGDGVNRRLLNRERGILIRFLAYAEDDDVLTVVLAFSGFVMDSPDIDTFTANAIYQ